MYVIFFKAKGERKRVRDGGGEIERERQGERKKGKRQNTEDRAERQIKRDREVEAKRRNRDERRSYTVSDIKKASWQKIGPVFQRLLSVVYSVAFDV